MANLEREQDPFQNTPWLVKITTHLSLALTGRPMIFRTVITCLPGGSVVGEGHAVAISETPTGLLTRRTWFPTTASSQELRLCFAAPTFDRRRTKVVLGLLAWGGSGDCAALAPEVERRHFCM